MLVVAASSVALAMAAHPAGSAKWSALEDWRVIGWQTTGDRKFYFASARRLDEAGMARVVELLTVNEPSASTRYEQEHSHFLIDCEAQVLKRILYQHYRTDANTPPPITMTPRVAPANSNDVYRAVTKFACLSDRSSYDAVAQPYKWSIESWSKK